MDKLDYFEKISEEDRSELEKLYTLAMEKWGHYSTKKKRWEPGTIVIITWACGWNKPSYVGRPAIVLMSSSTHCVVQMAERTNIGQKADLQFYRNEDLKAGSVETSTGKKYKI